jgi:hypothetical protein
MTSEPERADPLFAATEKFTVPLPLPLPPEVMLTKLSVTFAVQLHPPGAVTVTLPAPLAAVKFWLVGLTDVTQFVPFKNEEMAGYVTSNLPYWSVPVGMSQAASPPVKFPINLGPPGSLGRPFHKPEPDDPPSVVPLLQSTLVHCKPPNPQFGVCVFPNAIRLYSPPGW